jgi:AraC family transcriptional regulator of adaptative response/methylated-DNA-[protein]-cysteine methyltransferase
MKNAITWRILDSKLGRMIGGTTDKGVCLLEFVERKSLNTILTKLEKKHRLPLLYGATKILDKLQIEVTGYFNGELNNFSVPLDVRGTNFQLEVWQELVKIPYGETRSYNEIASAINRPSAVRAVGNANGDNNIAIIIPCHRVIGNNGDLTGYGGGLWRKKKLIDLEKKYNTKLKGEQSTNVSPIIFSQSSLEKWMD